MPDRIRRFVAPPTFDEEEKTQVARLLRRILIAVSITTFISAVLTLLSPAGPAPGQFPLLVVLISVVFCYLVHRRRITAASALFTSCVWLIVTLSAATNIGVRTGSFEVYVVVIIGAAILLNEQVAVGFTILSILT